MVDLDCGLFLFKFHDKKDYYYVFTGGLWIVMNHYLTVRKWEPNSKPLKANGFGYLAKTAGASY